VLNREHWKGRHWGHCCVVGGDHNLGWSDTLGLVWFGWGVWMFGVGLDWLPADWLIDWSITCWCGRKILVRDQWYSSVPRVRVLAQTVGRCLRAVPVLVPFVTSQRRQPSACVRVSCCLVFSTDHAPTPRAVQPSNLRRRWHVPHLSCSRRILPRLTKPTCPLRNMGVFLYDWELQKKLRQESRQFNIFVRVVWTENVSATNKKSGQFG
jgi:hypothetical protein